MKPRTAVICAVVIVAALLLTFGRAVTFDFVGGWDDGPLIVDNPLVNPPTAVGLKRIWTEPLLLTLTCPLTVESWPTYSSLPRL